MPVETIPDSEWDEAFSKGTCTSQPRAHKANTDVFCARTRQKA